MSDAIKTLEQAISDVGAWCWWAESFPKIFQIEFVGTQLWSPPIKEGQPPSGKIALQFGDPKSVSFIVRKNADIDLPEDWAVRLNKDLMEPQGISYDHFTMTDDSIIREILEQTQNISTVHGCAPSQEEFWNCPYKLAFWAGYIGVIIGSNGLKILNHKGDVGLSEIDGMSKKWWDYWRIYWKQRDTDISLPKDYACEVTLPVKS